MSKIALIAFARTDSSRLPNKVLYDLGGKPAFMHIIERITSVIDPDYVLVACNEDSRDDAIELLARQYGIDCFRGAENARRRVRAAGDSLGLRDDDIIIIAGCDNPLGVYKYIPYTIEQMAKYDCEQYLADIPKGTLVWGLYPICEIRSFGPPAEVNHGIHVVEGVSFGATRFFRGCRRIMRLKFPPEYLVPWPWGRLCLDWPPQACAIKEIYQQLYKGSPIDVLDVYKLMTQRPYLASIIPTEFPRHSKKGDAVELTRELYFEECKLLGMDIIELVWKEGKMKK